VFEGKEFVFCAAEFFLSHDFTFVESEYGFGAAKNNTIRKRTMIEVRVVFSYYGDYGD